jgi:hypothetical protein
MALNVRQSHRLCQSALANGRRARDGVSVVRLLGGRSVDAREVVLHSQTDDTSVDGLLKVEAHAVTGEPVGQAPTGIAGKNNAANSQCKSSPRQVEAIGA